MDLLDNLLEYELTRRLEQNFYLLQLIYHRNHNQHRVLVWWKHFNMLLRWIRKLLDKMLSLETCKKSAEKIRLRKEKLQILHFLANGRTFHNAYYAFNGIIALGQFIGLGIGLLAVTSSLHALVMHFYDYTENVPRASAPKATKKEKTPVPEDDDLGEEIAFESEAPLRAKEETLIAKPELPTERIPEKRNKERKEKKEKKKKKKSRNAIDDIFG